MVNVIVPAADILTGVAKTGTAFSKAFAAYVALAVAPLMADVDEPSEVPIDTVAEPPDVTAVVELMVPPTIIAFAGIVSEFVGEISP